MRRFMLSLILHLIASHLSRKFATCSILKKKAFIEILMKVVGRHLRLILSEFLFGILAVTKKQMLTRSFTLLNFWEPNTIETN